MGERAQKIKKLKDYFKKREDVVMAFLFGSQAKGYARMVSDWDIGVFLKEENREREHEIWGDIERVVSAEVDLVVLNRAPASIAWSIVRAGIPLSIKNRRTYLWFMIRSSHEANAWYQTSREYLRIFERSASLSEEDREALSRTVQFLEGEVSDYEKFKRLTWSEYKDDRVKKRDVERWAEQIMNAVINSAEIVLASERKVIPETYRLIVETLAIIPPFTEFDVCAKLAKWVDVRNILAHEYLDYCWKELSVFIQETEPFIREFIGLIRKFLDKK